MDEKMRMESVSMTDQNIEKIASLFPNCITEALDSEKSTPEEKVYKKVVNFDLLRQMLSSEVVEGEESYELTWVGKKAAIVEANTRTRQTLRPVPDESVNWDKTENLYIEGDNLTVLKQLQESYLGQVDMIFIDPPYDQGLEAEALRALSSSHLLNEDSLMVVEASIDTDFSYLDEIGLGIVKNKEYKTNKHVFIKKA